MCSVVYVNSTEKAIDNYEPYFQAFCLHRFAELADGCVHFHVLHVSFCDIMVRNAKKDYWQSCVSRFCFLLGRKNIIEIKWKIPPSRDKGRTAVLPKRNPCLALKEQPLCILWFRDKIGMVLLTLTTWLNKNYICKIKAFQYK